MITQAVQGERVEDSRTNPRSAQPTGQRGDPDGQAWSETGQFDPEAGRPDAGQPGPWPPPPEPGEADWPPRDDAPPHSA
ncbi:MAG: hypothetical protein WCA46_07565, partial [Actinocatenispora sp.]